MSQGLEDALRRRVAQLTQRVIDKDKEFQLERDCWKRKERQYQREIRELKGIRRIENDEEF